MARRRAGTVRKLPSGRWQARYLNPAGERINAPTTIATKGDAQRWLAATETDLGRGDWHDPRLGDLPYAEWAQRWLTLKEPHLAPSTNDLYRYLLRRHVAPRFGSTAVGRITAVDVQAWLADLHASHLSPNTVAKAYRLLKGSLDGAVEAGLLVRTPCTLKGAGTERHAEMRVATPEQITALATAAGPRWEALSSPPPTPGFAGASSPGSAAPTSTPTPVRSPSPASSPRSTAPSPSARPRPPPASAPSASRPSSPAPSRPTSTSTSTPTPGPTGSSSPPPTAGPCGAATSAAECGSPPPPKPASPG